MRLHQQAICRQCRKEFDIAATGRKPNYCSNACKQKAMRDRKKTFRNEKAVTEGLPEYKEQPRQHPGLSDADNKEIQRRSDMLKDLLDNPKYLRTVKKHAKELGILTSQYVLAFNGDFICGYRLKEIREENEKNGIKI